MLIPNVSYPFEPTLTVFVVFVYQIYLLFYNSFSVIEIWYLHMNEYAQRHAHPPTCITHIRTHAHAYKHTYLTCLDASHPDMMQRIQSGTHSRVSLGSRNPLKY